MVIAKSNKSNVESLIEMITSLPKNKDGIPLKEAFDPMTLPQLLPYYLLGKMSKPGSVIVKISGEKLNEVYSSPLTGLNIYDIMSGVEKEFVANLHKTMLERPCGVHTTRQLKKETGLTINLSTYSLPLISENSKDKYFLMYFEDQTAASEVNSMQGKLSELSPYTSLEFIDIGSGIPNDDTFIAELPTLSLA